ncbi:MAG: hypothetical protein ABW139_16005 [Candidatus Thiodiazotropha sp. DIVDIV]
MPKAKDSAIMKENNSNLPFYMSVPLAIFIVLLYMAFVFRGWASTDEFVILIPRFIAMGIAVGLFFSTLSLPKPLKFSFFTGTAAPLLSFLLYGLLETLISTAQAGRYEGDSDAFPLLVVIVLPIAISVVFGSITMLGCFLGLRIQNQIKKFYLSLNKQPKETGDIQIVAAKIGASATLAASMFSGIVSLLMNSFG